MKILVPALDQEGFARNVLAKWGPGSKTARLLREAALANVADMSPDEAFRTIESLLPPSSALQSGPWDILTVVLPGEPPINIRPGRINELTYYQLIGQEVMCS